jgi:Glycosyl hydrolase family 26
MCGRRRRAVVTQLCRPARAFGPGRGASVALLSVIATAVSVMPLAVPAGAATSNAVLGVYAGAAYPRAVPAFTEAIGAKPKYAMDFLLGTTWRTITQGRWPYTKWKGKGYTMIWGVNMLPDTYSPNPDAQQSGGSCHGLTQGAEGDFDHYFRTVGANIVRAGFPVSVIRFGWEFNGNWAPWAADGCASAFVKYFDAIVTTMRSVPGSHFTFEWNPTRGDLGVGNLSQYYPGNRYVDDIGLDVYDIEGQVYPGAAAEYRHMLTQPDGLDWVASFAEAHDKPIVLPEWGLGWGTCSKSGQPIAASGKQVCGGDNAAWINLMTTWISTHNVAEATYWDFQTSSVGRGQNPLTAKVLASRFAAPA